MTCESKDVIIEFFEEDTLVNSRYNSGNVVLENYDVLELPYVDKEYTETMHLVIHNISDGDAQYTAEIRGFELQ